MFKKILITSVAFGCVAGAATAQEMDNDDQLRPELSASGAKIEGNKIVGVHVKMDRDGFVVIHDEAAGAPPANLGFAKVNKGVEIDDLVITSTGTLDPSNNVTVMMHYDTNGNGTYDFGPGSTDVDTPAMAGGEAITDTVQ